MLSPICFMWMIPLSCRCRIKSAGNLWALPQPTHGSKLIRTTFHSLMCHVIPSYSRGSELMTAFHILEMLFLVPCCRLIQSIRFMGQIYFNWTTWDQRLLLVMSCQPNLAASAFEKRSSLLMPHPPQLLGFSIVSHLTQANILPCWLPFQRNLQQILCNLFNIPFSIHAKVIQ